VHHLDAGYWTGPELNRGPIAAHNKSTTTISCQLIWSLLPTGNLTET